MLCGQYGNCVVGGRVERCCGWISKHACMAAEMVVMFSLGETLECVFGAILRRILYHSKSYHKSDNIVTNTFQSNNLHEQQLVIITRTRNFSWTITIY